MIPLPYIDIPVAQSRPGTPLREIANRSVYTAKKHGILPRKGPCALCGCIFERPAYHAHHDDYNLPGRVTMLLRENGWIQQKRKSA